MTAVRDIIKILDSVTRRDAHFFFICNDAVNALSMSALVRNLHIISYGASPLTEPLRKEGVNVSLLGAAGGDKLCTTNNLIAHMFTKVAVSRVSGSKNLLVFKNSAIVEEYAAKLGLRLLAAPANISRRIENKVRFYETSKGKGIPFLPGETLQITDSVDFDDIAGRFGAPFVLQASKGFAGNKTYLINRAADLTDIKAAYNKRVMRLTKYTPGATLTINACATSLGTIVKPPFHQLTGYGELTSNRLGACGNDFRIDDIDRATVDEIVRVTRNIGDMIYSAGYKGIFGVDYIVNNDKVYFVECNPRLVTSLPLFTQIERQYDEPPLIAFHILEQLGEMQSAAELFERFKSPVNRYIGSQIIMHNLTGAPKRVSADLKCGVYKSGGGLKLVREGYKLSDIKDDGEFLVIPKAYGNTVNPGMEYARVITAGRAFTEDGLRGDIKMIINQVTE